MTHVIRQQFLDVVVQGTEADGLALQSRLSDTCEHRLRPTLERALNRCAPANGHLFIERLDVNIGMLPLERLEQELAEKLTQALEKSLGELTSSGKAIPTIASGNVKYKTKEQALHEVFLYFLKTGSLPWSFRLPADQSLEHVLLHSWQEAPNADTGFSFTSNAVLQALTSVSVRKRLVQQFSSVFLAAFFSRFSPEDQKVITALLHALRNSDVRPVVGNQFEKHLWEAALAFLAAGNAITAQQLIAEACRTLPASVMQQASLVNWLEHQWPGAKADASIQPSSTSTDRKIPRAPKPSSLVPGETAGEFLDKQQTVSLSATTGQRLADAGKAPLPLSMLTVEQETPSKQATKKHLIEHPDASEGIYIGNAGLVLLHPFLPRLFEALGIATEDRLQQPERALCLLHFLATGQLFAPEYELILPKILCNIQLETPVESGLELTTLEKEEAVALLESLIRHWEVLQNTSPDGLRGTFLLRPGKVSLRDDGDWLLQVEAQSFDILLDQLPWGIGMIKLPWMTKMLWVEWR